MFCGNPTEMPRDFAPLERKIEETVERLKATKDPFLRRDVLKELRRLLDEADRVLKEPPRDYESGSCSLAELPVA
jgi:hypothetical protein